MSIRTKRSSITNKSHRRTSTSKHSTQGLHNQIVANNLGDCPLFSIIILSFQQQDMLFRSIDSVLEQDYPNVELVICDDGSSDFDEREVRKHIAQSKRSLRRLIVFQHPENVGIVQNAQKGVELSSGRYFKILAADDFFYGDTVLSRMAGLFEDPEIKIIASLSVACTLDGTITNTFYPAAGSFECMKDADASQQFALLGTQSWCEFISSPAVFWKRELFDVMGGFDLSFHIMEDWPMWLRITESGQRITMVNDATVVYRYGGLFNTNNEKSREYKEIQYKESIRLLQEIALPHFTNSKEKRKVMRCQQSIDCNKAKLVCELEWPYWSVWRKIGWRINNIRFLAISWLYRTWQRGITIKWRFPLIGMAICIVMFMLHAQIKPGQSADMFWSWGFVLFLCWFVLKVLISAGFRTLSFLLRHGGHRGV